MGQPSWRPLRTVTVPDRAGNIWTPALDYITPNKLYLLVVEAQSHDSASAAEATTTPAPAAAPSTTTAVGTTTPAQSPLPPRPRPLLLPRLRLQPLLHPRRLAISAGQSTPAKTVPPMATPC